MPDYQNILPTGVPPQPIARAGQTAQTAEPTDIYGSKLVTWAPGGKHLAACQTGNLFVATIATAAAVPISTSLTFVLALWNPTGSSVRVIPAKITLGYVSGTEVPGNMVLSYIKNAGATPAVTGNPFATATAITAQSALLGSSNTSKVQALSAGTLTTAATIYYTIGLSHLTTTATATYGTVQNQYDFEGSQIVDPGNAILLMANAATVTLYQQSIWWYEVGL